MNEEYEKAIKALLARVETAENAAEAARLAEVAINLSHAAVAMAAANKGAKSGEADNGSAGS